MNDELELFIDNFTSKEKEALKFASKVHKGTYRKGTIKEEYIWHPIRVAYLVNKYKTSKSKEDLICAALLHDTIEDTITDKNDMYNDIVDAFGIQTASLVKELTTVDDFKNAVGKTKYLGIKLNDMSSYALVIKLCDRLDNVSDLDNVSTNFKEKYLNETIHVLYMLLTKRNEKYISSTHLIIIRDILKKVLSYGEKSFIKQKTIN